MSPRKKRKKEPEMEPASHALTALIIDDVPTNREEMRYHVRALGHACVEVGCLDEARKRLADTRIDYVLLDLQIPWAPNTLAQTSFGEAFLEELVRDHPDLPVVVVTGYGRTIAHSVKIVHAGPCVSFVTKPFDDEDPENPHLTEEINRVLQKRQALMETESKVMEEEPMAEAPTTPPQIATIDVARVGRYRHLQVFCTLDGRTIKLSKRQRQILELFAEVQSEHPDRSERHQAPVDLTPVFEVPGDPKRSKEAELFNIRYSAINKLKKRLEAELPAGHPLILQPADAKGWYRLGCYCICSTPDVVGA